MTGRPAAVRRDQSFPRRERIRRRSEYQRCYREGRRRHGESMILYGMANELEHPRLGITVSRKVGNSVVRHRVKRRLREIYRRWSGRAQLPSLDLMIHVKPAAARASYATLETELTRLLATWLLPDRAAS